MKTLEDMKGLKVRAPTRIATKVLTALGAVPVQMPRAAGARGAVQGRDRRPVVSLGGRAGGSRSQEIAKTHTETPPGQPYMSNTIFVVAMNQAKYDSLPPDLKKVIDANSGLAASKWAGQFWDATVAPARKLSPSSARNTINVLTAAEFERWRKATEGVDKEWFTEVAAKGGNGPALLRGCEGAAQEERRLARATACAMRRIRPAARQAAGNFGRSSLREGADGKSGAQAEGAPGTGRASSGRKSRTRDLRRPSTPPLPGRPDRPADASFSAASSSEYTLSAFLPNTFRFSAGVSGA